MMDGDGDDLDDRGRRMAMATMHRVSTPHDFGGNANL